MSPQSLQGTDYPEIRGRRSAKALQTVSRRSYWRKLDREMAILSEFVKALADCAVSRRP